jgi:HEAT repeat protein
MAGRNPKKGSQSLSVTPRKSAARIPHRLSSRAPGRDGLISQAIRRLSSRSSETRISAAFELADFGDKRAVRPLSELLNDPDPEVRRAVCAALGEIHDPSSVPFLVKRLKDADANVRMAAAESLGRINDKSSVTALLRSLTDRNAQVRRSAAEALGNLGDENAVSVLCPLIAGGARDPSHYVRIAAAKALGKIADPDSREELASAAQYDQNVLVRMTATHSLKRLESS